MDHITVYLSGNDKLAKLVEKNSDQISKDVLAQEIKYGENADNSKEWDINGEKITLGVTKL